MQAFTEKEVIKGCCKYDRAFQEYLYHQYSGLFLKLCVRYAANFHDAEQLLQDAFLKIFSSIQQYGNKGSFEGWMRRIVVNTCLDYLRSKQFKENRQTNLVEIFPENVGFQCEATVLQKMNLESLVVLIQSLPPMSRAVFNLFVMEGYSHKEIAQQLNISEGTSQWHVNNARQSLQKKIMQNRKLKSFSTIKDE